MGVRVQVSLLLPNTNKVNTVVNLENLKTYLPKGWENVADMLYSPLTEFVRGGGRVSTVKEKFGELRVYMQGGIEPNLAEAENLADRTCLECGEPAVAYQRVGWCGPRCEKHLTK